ncbi:MAG: site-specific integrase [Bacteroidales bacterium]|nr:site-specific integrase [Candidatus Scybalousia scybalohippi]
MTIEKLPSGSYRLKKMYKGKRYSLTVQNKPTKRVAEDLMNEHITATGAMAKKNMTFKDAVDAYCTLKSNILSPSTIVGYKKSLRQLSEDFRQTLINDIEQLTIQKEINDLSAKLAPKTVRNANGLIAAVLKTYRNGLHYDINLPQSIASKSHIPTETEIKQILNAVKGTDYYVPFALGTMGMRRSEICALTIEDLSDDNMLTINKAKVQNEDKKWVIKPYPKTEDSQRTIYLPPELADLIRSQGYIFTAHPERLLDHLHSTQKQLGIKSFRFHDLRHYFATMAHAMGIPDKYIQLQGGWKTDHIMKKVYRHSLDDEYEKTQKQYVDRLFKK